MNPHRVPKSEDRLVQDWLELVGWSAMPFARPDNPTEAITAAEDEAGVLGEYFLPSAIEQGWPWESGQEEKGVDDDRDYIHLLLRSEHTIVFGHPGDGKSACRIVVAQEAKKRGCIVLPYLRQGSSRSPEEHAAQILTILEATDESSSRAGTDSNKSTLAEPNGLSRLVNRIGHLQKYGRQDVFVMVDDVAENAGPFVSAESVMQSIHYLFDPQLIHILGLSFKFFLPDNLVSSLVQYQVIRGGKHPFRIMRIRWTAKRLRQVIERRIEQISTTGNQLQAIASDKLDKQGRRFTSVDDEVIQDALSGTGEPRNLSRLVHEMMMERINASLDSESFLLTPNDLDVARSRVYAVSRILAYIRSQKSEIYQYEDQLIKASISHDTQALKLVASGVDQIYRDVLRTQDDLIVSSAALASEMRYEFQVLKFRLDALRSGQTLMGFQLAEIRRDILDIAAVHQNDIQVLIDGIQKVQLEMIRAVMQAVDQNRIERDDMREAIALIEKTVDQIRANTDRFGNDEFVRSLLNIGESIKNEAGVDHKFKLALPLIPAILTYEFEFVIGGRADLTKAVGDLWQRLQQLTRNSNNA